jgi:hypothetical protein
VADGSTSSIAIRKDEAMTLPGICTAHVKRFSVWRRNVPTFRNGNRRAAILSPIELRAACCCARVESSVDVGAVMLQQEGGGG